MNKSELLNGESNLYVQLYGRPETMIEARGPVRRMLDRVRYANAVRKA